MSEEIEVGLPAHREPLPPKPNTVAQLAPPLLTSTEGVAVRSLSLVPPDVSRLLLLFSGILATSAGFLADPWHVVATLVAALLAATCGVASPVPHLVSGKLKVSGAISGVALTGAGLLANEATQLAEGWPRALALVGVAALSFVAGKPVNPKL